MPRAKDKKQRKVAETAFKRLKDLPNFDTVHARLCAGVSCEEMGRWLQDDCDLATDISRGGLIRQLYRYKKTIPDIELVGKETLTVHKKTERFAHRVNSLEEATRLYELQLLRISKALDTEEKSPFLMGQVGHEMDRAMAFLRTIMAIKTELGLAGKGGEKDVQIGDATEDILVGGVMAVIAKRYGPEAHDKLAYVGKKLQETMIRELRPKSPSLDAIPNAEVTHVATTVRQPVQPAHATPSNALVRHD